MCAIFGILGDFDPKQARRCLASMAHRGPDHCGIVEAPELFFAHNRLSILDLDARAHQPMAQDRILLSFNGEIYNHHALRRELETHGYGFETASDTEVLIAAYRHWGVEFVHRLVGMFAIALKDGETLYLFRDRLGKKPLFYLQDADRFAFASEIKALVPLLRRKRMNEDALMSYLSFLAPTPPHTFYEGICKLEAGSVAVRRGATLKVEPYYDLLASANRIESREEALRLIDVQLHRAIETRLEADVPMAALLSGGVDSALLAAIAKAAGTELVTFTLGYDSHRNYDEREQAAASAKAIGVANVPVEISRDLFIEASDRVFAAMDEPLNDPAAVPLYLLFETIAAEGYRVVLSGEGSDELFLGYRQYFEYLDIEKASQLHHKNWLKKYFRAHFSMNREWEWYKRVFDETLLFRTSGEKFTDLQKNALMRRNVKDNESLRYLRPYRDRFERSAHSDESVWYSYVDLMLFQAEHFLTKLDRVSMAHSVESRTPYLDHRLCEAVFSIEPKRRYEEGVTKALLKSVAAPYLPEAVLKRKKKGFSNPYMEWLDASGRLERIVSVNAQTGLFRPEVLERYLHSAKRGRFKQHVWGLYALSHWIERELL